MAKFSVHSGRIRAAGEAALEIGQRISAMTDEVGPACDVSTTLDVGAALVEIGPLWRQHLSDVGADVQQTGRNLCAAADNYTATDTGAASSFQRISA